MDIIYRISSRKPDNPAVFYSDNKRDLVQMSHNSFLKAGGGKYNITYLLSDCAYWENDFNKYGKVINLTHKKKLETLYTALDIARHMEDKVFLIEDDYLWRPDTIPVVESALDVFPVVSPYDHPGHYTEEQFDHKYEIKLLGGLTYRTCPSNTHTFATRAKIIADHWDIFVDEGRKLANYDHPAFSALNKDAQMWCPLYSFATHLATGCLAPNINWLDLT